MIIVKMDKKAVECSIAAAELREIGLTPEAIVSGDRRGVEFLAQINQEMGKQLEVNPDQEIMMTTRNMLVDGSLRIFAVKMNNQDIEKTGEGIRQAGKILEDLAEPDRIREIMSKNGREKSDALAELFSSVGEVLSNMYMQGGFGPEKKEMEVETLSKPALSYSRYMAEFDSLSRCSQFCRVISALKVKDSALYKYKNRYHLMLGLELSEDREVYEIRRCGVEYADGFSVNSPEELHVIESGDCIIREDALLHLKDLS